MKYLLLVALVLFSGCSSKWESSATVGKIESSGEILYAKAPSDMSLIYLYRESAFAGSATAWHLKLNEKSLGKLKNGSYLLLKTTPGKKLLNPESHVLSLSDKPFELNAEAGKSYFLRHGNSSVFSSEITFFPKSAVLARAELSKYDLVNIYEVYDPSYMKQRQIAKQKCPSSSNMPECIATLADIRGKVIVNRGSDGFRAKPGMQLRVGDKVITSDSSEAFLMLYGEPKMVRVNSTFEVLAPN